MNMLDWLHNSLFLNYIMPSAYDDGTYIANLGFYGALMQQRSTSCVPAVSIPTLGQE